MSEPVTCGQCGAKNPPQAQWCNQCYASFAPPPPAAPPPPPPPPPPPLAAEPPPSEEWTIGADSNPTSLTIGAALGDLAGVGAPAPPDHDPAEPTWTCRACGRANPLSVDVCPICQTTIFESHGADRAESVSMDPGEAARWALLPGLAHGKLGHGLLGFTIAALVAALAAIGLMLLAVDQAAGGILLLLIGVGVIGASAYDATQLASGNPDAIVLRPRTITIIAGVSALIALLVVGLRGTSTGS